MKRHSTGEKKSAWDQAREMTARGNTQSDICKALGISVMTFHRWRRELGDPSEDVRQSTSLDEISEQIAILRDENARLRRIVTDLMLEKTKIEDANKQGRIPST
jgi:putative transposase